MNIWVSADELPPPQLQDETYMDPAHPGIGGEPGLCPQGGVGMRQLEKDELIASLGWRALVFTAPNKPGALIEKMKKETRDKLQRLTADDYRRMRLK